MNGMARGKRKNEPPRGDVEWVLGALEEIKMALGPDESVAKALGVSRNAWRKWMAKDSFPVSANYARIREVLQEVRARATKVAPVTTMTSPASPTAVLGSAPRVGHNPDARTELANMGVLVAAVAAGEEPTYLLELEICLWYHRDEVSRGDISQTAISAAREGFFEDRGCQTWLARRWWSELTAHTNEMRSKLRRLRPGVLSDPKH